MLYDQRGFHGIFNVRDRYVRCVRVGYGTAVYKDSAVEFFVEPRRDAGYLNFEFNCGGAHLCYYITDATLVRGKWRRAVPVPSDLGRQVRVKSSLPAVVDPEIATPIRWTLQFFIPFAVIEAFVGALDVAPGQVWRGNFFKCATEVSHPHWAAWAPVSAFNFHLPACFGRLSLVE